MTAEIVSLAGNGLRGCDTLLEFYRHLNSPRELKDVSKGEQSRRKDVLEILERRELGKMNQRDFEDIFEETIQKCRELLIVKGGEYAGSEDRLSNFKRGAQLTGSTPLQVALIYLSKHYDAIATFVRDDAGGVSRTRSEGIEGRLDDLINYCILMKGLIREKAAIGEDFPWNNLAVNKKLENWQKAELLRSKDPI